MGGHPLFRAFERQPIQGVDNVVGAIREEAASQRAEPPSGDPVIGAMWDGFLHALDKDSAVQGLVKSYAADQQVIVEPWTVGGVPMSEVNGLLRTAFQFDSIRHGVRFPVTRLGWARQLSGLANDPRRSAAVETVLHHYHTMTTSGDRVGPFEVVRQLKGESAGFLDAASSVGVGARQTQLKDDGHPFSPVRLLHENGSDDIAASSGYAQLVGAPVLPGAIVMTDLLPPDSRLARRLSLASLRPSEILDPDFVEKRQQLLAKKLSNLIFVQSNLTDRESMVAVREYCRTLRIRTAFIGTVLNIVGQENVITVIDNVLSMLEDHPDSEAIIADFAQVDRRKPYGLSLLPRWGQAPYGYFGVRKYEPERVNSLFRFTNSRPRVGRVEDGDLAVAGEVHPIRDLIAARAAGSAVVQREISPLALSTFA